jgi:hypothetical protein
VRFPLVQRYDLRVQTTITLTAAAEHAVRTLMADRGLSFEEAINAAILESENLAPFETPVHRLGESRVSLDRALAIADELADESIAS